MNRFLDWVLYRYGWDTRVRSQDVIAAIRPDLAPDIQLLDVGSGDRGLAAFLPRNKVVGVDVQTVPARVSNLILHEGSITSLPFPANSFSHVVCIDTLEHLAPNLRNQAVSELVRVARYMVVIACPAGSAARVHDERFRTALHRRGKTVPAWLQEHLTYEYPHPGLLLDALNQAAEQSQKSITATSHFSESLWISGLVRAAAARSAVFYGLVNLIAGIIYPITPRPSADDGYRVIIKVLLRPCEAINESTDTQAYVPA